MRRPLASAVPILLLAACDLTPKLPGAEQRSAGAEVANTRELRRACASAATFDRLKALAFDEALKVRNSASDALDAIASESVLRMENPVAKSRDNDLNVTVCTGRLVLELPPGVEDAFDGKRRLEADVEYAAQEAVDGSGLVYQMQGAEPIVYRLAAIDLKRGRPSGVQVAAREPTTLPSPTAAPLPPSETIAAASSASPPTLAREAPPPKPPVAREVPAAQPPTETRTAARPSFNCRYARSQSERLVCGSGRLAQQDRAMSSDFYAALAGADPRTRSALRDSRDRFLRARDRCGSEACVSEAYAARVAEIRAIREGQ